MQNRGLRHWRLIPLIYSKLNFHLIYNVYIICMYVKMLFTNYLIWISYYRINNICHGFFMICFRLGCYHPLTRSAAQPRHVVSPNSFECWAYDNVCTLHSYVFCRQSLKSQLNTLYVASKLFSVRDRVVLSINPYVLRLRLVPSSIQCGML